MVDGHHKALLGITYLLVVGLLIGSSILAYRKDFPWQHATPVTLHAAKVGLELNVHSDVKFQGVRVGEVRDISSDGNGATVELALDDDRLDLLPANVDAAIVPKTMFGEKFVDLRLPADPVSERMAAGGEIRQSTTSVEVGQLFSKLVPFLRALGPEKLSTMLTSMAEAVDGRGATLARVLNQLSDYLTEFNPHLDTLGHDFRQLARTMDVYADSAPEIVQLLEAATGISEDLLVPKREKFGDFLDGLIRMSGRAEDVLDENSRRMITLASKGRPILALLHEYAEALSCTLSGLRTYEALANQAVGTHGPFMTLRYPLLVDEEGYTYPDDLPSNTGSDAHASKLPPPVPSFAPHCPRFSDEVLGLKNPGLYSQPMFATSSQPGAAAFNSSSERGSSGTPHGPIGDGGAPAADPEAALARALAARLMNLPQEAVPPYASMLVQPMLSDGKVDVP